MTLPTYPPTAFNVGDLVEHRASGELGVVADAVRACRNAEHAPAFCAMFRQPDCDLQPDGHYVVSVGFGRDVTVVGELLRAAGRRAAWAAPAPATSVQLTALRAGDWFKIESIVYRVLRPAARRGCVVSEWYEVGSLRGESELPGVTMVEKIDRPSWATESPVAGPVTCPLGELKPGDWFRPVNRPFEVCRLLGAADGYPKSARKSRVYDPATGIATGYNVNRDSTPVGKIDPPAWSVGRAPEE